MKKILLLCLLALTTGCNASEPKSIEQLKMELAEKEAALEQAKKSGGYRVVNLPAVCVNGVLYYQSYTYGGNNTYALAWNMNKGRPYKCDETDGLR